MKLTMEDKATFLAAQRAFGEIHDKFVKRVEEVLAVITACFHKKKFTSFWLAGSEGLNFEINDDRVCYSTSESKTLDSGYSKGWDYTYDFPMDFMYMDNEDIKKEILKEIELAESEKTEKKLKKLASVKDKEEKKKQALAKLTKEERKALGV